MRYLLLALLILPATLATNATNNSGDLSLTIILSEEIFAHTTYTSLFTLRNERHVTGIRSAINATVNYTLTRNNSLITNGSFTKTINSYSSAKTGELLINSTGVVELCGHITNTSISDENESNNHACKNITVKDPFLESCNISLHLDTERQLYQAGETIRFTNRIEGENIPPYIIKYTTRELFNRSIAVKTTTNTREKRFTPKIEGESRVFIIENSFDMLACNNSNNQTKNQNIVVVKGTLVKPEKASSISIENLHEPKNGYTFGNQMRITAAIYRGETLKRAVKFWVEDTTGRKVSATTSVNAQEKFTEYYLTLPIQLKDFATLDTKKYSVVAEGLEARAEKSLKINQKKSKGKSTPKKEEQQESEIRSFYTRSRVSSKSINLYATITGEPGNIELLADNQSSSRKKGKEDLHFRERVAIAPGSNLYILQYKDSKGKLLDERTLILHMNSTITSADAFFFPQPEACPVLQCERAEEEREIPKNMSKQQEQPANLLTGATIYEAEGETRTLPLLLGVIGMLLLGLILQHK